MSAAAAMQGRKKSLRETLLARLSQDDKQRLISGGYLASPAGHRRYISLVPPPKFEPAAGGEALPLAKTKAKFKPQQTGDSSANTADSGCESKSGKVRVGEEGVKPNISTGICQLKSEPVSPFDAAARESRPRPSLPGPTRRPEASVAVGESQPNALCTVTLEAVSIVPREKNCISPPRWEEGTKTGYVADWSIAVDEVLEPGTRLHRRKSVDALRPKRALV